jgi:hypothetical protein
MVLGLTCDHQVIHKLVWDMVISSICDLTPYYFSYSCSSSPHIGWFNPRSFGLIQGWTKQGLLYSVVSLINILELV